MPTVFVYGALMDTPRAQEHGRPAVVRDHAARFVARGIPGFEPAFLGLIEAPGDAAHGLVFEVDDAEWKRMSSHEASYERRTLDADVGGEVVPALALLLPPRLVSTERAPSARYARRVARGARGHLPPAVVDRYEELARTGSKLSTWLNLVAVVRALSTVLGPRPALFLVAAVFALVVSAVVSAILGALGF